MNRNTFTYLLLLALLAVSNLLLAQDDLFDDSFVHEIRINSTDPNFWQTIDEDYSSTPNGEAIPYRVATVTVDGVVLDSVGVRQKGFSSNFFVQSTKKPLKINFDKFRDGQNYLGLTMINLANGVGDPAITKDKLAYDMFRYHGIPGPRVVLTRVYVQDEYWGTYGIIEQIDKEYLRRNFADDDGNLWKNKGYSNMEWYGPNPEAYTFELQTNKAENDWSQFIELLDTINNVNVLEIEEALGSIFHVDEYLRILAIDLVTNNWDSYVDHGRNWYLYHEPKSDKIHWLPWDYNFAFNRGANFGDGDLSIINTGTSKPLISRILSLPNWRNTYLNYVCEVLEYNMVNERIDAKLDQHLDLVDNAWGAPNDFYDVSALNDAINGASWSDVIWFGSDFQGLKKFIGERSTVVQEELASFNHTCPVLEASVNPQDIVINEFMASNGNDSDWKDQDGENDDWIELYNNTDNDILLDNYFLSNQSSFLHKWEFPDSTVLPANGYLIVWADRDVQQEGLHTQFKLDKDEDDLYLSHLDGTLVDSVSWTEEIDQNTSLSRIPNGTGPFVNVDVTFGGINGYVSDVDNISNVPSVKVYPNPVSGQLYIQLEAIHSESDIRLYDATGKELRHISNARMNTAIDVSNLVSGFYYVKVTNHTLDYTAKVMVQ